MARLLRGYMNLVNTHPWKTQCITAGKSYIIARTSCQNEGTIVMILICIGWAEICVINMMKEIYLIQVVDLTLRQDYFSCNCLNIKRLSNKIGDLLLSATLLVLSH